MLERFLSELGAFIRWLARAIVNDECQTKRAFVFTYTSEDGRINIGDFKNMELRKNQSVTVTAKPLDAAGNPAEIQKGSAVWASSDAAIVSITPNPANELEAQVSSNTATGAVVLTLTADGDPSAGGDLQIVGSADVRVLGENAVGFDLSFGTPATA